MNDEILFTIPGAWPVHVHGRCDARFNAVREAFAQNFSQRDEVGAAVAITLDGVQVVDLWGGYRDAARTQPWVRDTIVGTNSVAKGVTVTALLMLVDQGKVDVDAPVARYWPEFAQNGKAKLPVRYLLDHRAGLPIVDSPRPGMAYVWNEITKALATQKPLWEPGSTPCYHAATHGFLTGEIVRRVSGKSPGTFIRDHIAGPLGMDWHLGLRPDEETRCADFLAKMTVHSDPEALFTRAWKIFAEGENFNSKEWRRSEIPSAGGHGNARALARLCGALARGGEVDGIRLMSKDTIEFATREQWQGTELVGRYMRFGLGLLLNCKGTPMGANPRNFGMFGAGGHVAICDPDARIGFAYTMNRMDPGKGFGERAEALIQAALG